MKQVIVWQRLDFTAVEHLTFDDSGGEKTAAGHIVGVSDNAPFAVSYKIEIAADWRVSGFEVQSLGGAQKLRMTSDGDGVWFDETGAHREDFDGCFDIDLTLTPLTNTLPIRRLQLAGGERKQIAVLYIELPEFNIKRVTQFYTKIAERRYLYESYPEDFRAELPLDENYFVIDYPQLFRRVYPKN